MRRILIYTALVLPIVVHAEVMTMQQCIDTALVNNLALQTSQNSYESSRIQYQQSLTNLSPSISGGISQGFSFGRSTGADNITRSVNNSNTNFNLGANILLFDGLAMKFAIDQARANMNATEAQLSAQELQIRQTITTMYLQVLLHKMQRSVAEAQLEDTRRLLEKNRALVAAERLAEGEIYTLEAQEAQEELSVVQARNSHQLALLDLAQAMNLRDLANFDIVEVSTDDMPSILPNQEEVYELALQNRPELKVLSYQIDAAEAGLKGRKAAYSPSISASAGVGSGYYHMNGAENAGFGDQMKDNFSANVGINLVVPIYDKMQTPHAVKQQKLTVENAKIQLEQKQQDIRKQIDAAYYDAVNAYQEWQSAKKAEKSQQQAMNYTGQKYEAGRATDYEYTTAKTNSLRATTTRLQAEYTYYFRLYLLQSYTGL